VWRLPRWPHLPQTPDHPINPPTVTKFCFQTGFSWRKEHQTARSRKGMDRGQPAPIDPMISPPSPTPPEFRLTWVRVWGTDNSHVPVHAAGVTHDQRWPTRTTGEEADALPELWV
jgi:hypothetical protein